MMKQFIFSCILFFTHLPINAALYESPWLTRTGKYETPREGLILIISPKRCGSTLTYNVARILWEEEDRRLYKHHFWVPEVTNSNLIVCVRNPYEAACSLLRVQNEDRIIDEVAIKEVALKMIEDFRNCRQCLHVNKAGILLKYEEDIENLDKLLNRLEVWAGATFNKADKNFIKKVLTKKNVQNYLEMQGIDNFQKSSPDDYFRGNHIKTHANNHLKGKEKWIRDHLSCYFLKHKALFQYFGYDVSL